MRKLSILLTVLALVIVGLASGSPATAAANTSHLFRGEWLTSGQQIQSPNGGNRLVMQTDGNLVEYGPAGEVIWNSRTWGHPGAQAILQADGNFVIYSVDGVALWHTGTYGAGVAYLVIQDDANVVLYPESGPAIWSLINSALERIAAGSWDQKDLSFIEKWPDLAAQVQDPRQQVEFDTTISPRPIRGAGEFSDIKARVLSSNCKEVHGWIALPSLFKAYIGDSFGTILYKWHHRVRFCYNGTKVTSITRENFATEVDAHFIRMGGLVANNVSPVPETRVVSLYQRVFENYVPFVGKVVSTTSPMIRIVVRGDGTWSARGSA